MVIEIEVDGFRMLLTGDAEEEAAPVAPGPLDVLKVAHHGSEDAGLPSLLGSADPELAVVSVGEGNSYGHPTEGTMDELEEAGTETLRTDEDGTISIVVDRRWLQRGNRQLSAARPRKSGIMPDFRGLAGSLSPAAARRATMHLWQTR